MQTNRQSLCSHGNQLYGLQALAQLAPEGQEDGPEWNRQGEDEFRPLLNQLQTS